MWYAKMYFSEKKEVFQFDSHGVQGVPSTYKEFPFLESLLSFLETDCKELEPLLRKVDAVIGQEDVPLPGVGEADAQMLRQGLTEPGKGVGVINELLAGYPRSQSHRRRGDHQDLASIQGDAREEPLQPLGGLFRTSSLEQVVGPKHDDQQIGISRKVRGH